jgi:molecular chaperone DnaK
MLEAHPNADEMSDAEVDEMKAAKEKLMNSAQKVFTKMYEQQAAQQQGQAGPGPDMNAGQTAGGNDDDVVDADYKEI